MVEWESQLQVSSSDQHNGGTTFFKTCFNWLNALTGIGMLSVPYAVSDGGWLSLMLLIFFAIICWYTALLLERCMNMHPLIKSYADIGEVAFGYKGRFVISIFLYLELFLVAVELLILEGANLEKLFPNISLRIGGRWGFVLLTALIILPTTWLRSLVTLSHIAVGGVLASIVLFGCVAWVGEVDGIGFHERGKIVNWSGLPTSVSIFAFCYGSHSLVPTIYNSMKYKDQFSKVLLFCFVASTMIYGSMATLGYMMFGDELKSQITLNLPTNKISSKIAIYTTVINPFTKYAIIITPIANAIEDKWSLCKRRPITILIRTFIVVISVLVALFVPFFHYMMAFIGAFLCVTISLLFPCLCYLKINKDSRRFGLELMIILGILFVGTFIGVHGAYISVMQIVNNMTA